MRGTFTLNRFGRIKLARGLRSKNQCKSVGHGEYDYCIRLSAGTKLDKEGFLIDHALINDAILKAAALPDSCEKICLLIRSTVEELFDSRDIRLRNMHIMLTPVLTPAEKASPNKAFMELETKY